MCTMPKIIVRSVGLLFFIQLMVIVETMPTVLANETSKITAKEKICADAKVGISEITVEALKKKMSNNDQFVLLDIRTEGEYRAGYISGAVWVPRGMLELKIEEVIPDSEKEIVIYCGQGCRGYLAVRSLIAMGYKKVSNLKGGVREWVNDGNILYNMLGELQKIRYGVRDPKAYSE